MSRKSGERSKLILAFVILVAVGGVLAVSSSNVKVSVISGIIVIAAVLESALILGGIALLNRGRPHPGSTGDSN